jgi:hypothetical protein
MMKAFMCFLTGGHKYADENIKSELIPDDTKHIILSNECVKCGCITEFIMDVDAQIKHDMAVMKGGEG